MNINIYNSIKNKNIKLIKQTKYITFAGALALSSLITGCSKETKINDKYTINDVINSEKDKTTLDDNLEIIKMKTKEKKENLTWKEAHNKYIEARKEKDIKKCNKYLYVMQKMLLECKLLEALNYELNNNKIISFKIKKEPTYIATLKYKTKETNIVPGGITEETNKENIEIYYLDNLSEDIAINISRAYNEQLDFSEEDIEKDTNIDDCYRKMCKFALGNSEINKGLFGNINFKVNEPSKKKIKVLKLNK